MLLLFPNRGVINIYFLTLESSKNNLRGVDQVAIGSKLQHWDLLALDKLKNLL
jgi:hypothetical protein